ncbi:hypothetical protein [Spongiimicrobium salis]|uniref:hypothetical protein n=1 Tax=Spongiimicrobium salis TaxID=1667022 RepID=UPI00374CBC39
MLFRKKNLLQLGIILSLTFSSCSSEDVSGDMTPQSENPTNPSSPDNTPPEDGSSMQEGLPVITIEGAISNEEAQAIIDRDGGTLTTWITISNTTGLTQIDLSTFTALGNRLLIFNNADLEEVLVPNLERVDDQIQLSNNTVLTEISFPVLRTTGVLSIAESTALNEIRADRLESLDRLSLVVVGNGNTNINFPRLSNVGQEIFISSVSMQNANFPQLQTIDGRLLFQDVIVAQMNFNALQEIKSFTLRDVALLEEIDFPQLRSVIGDISTDTSGNNNGDVHLGSMSISSCTQLSRINFPLLEEIRTGNFLIKANPLLTQSNFERLSFINANLDFSENNQLQNMAFPVLTEVTREMRIHQNPALLAADFGALSQVGTKLVIWGSNDLEVFNVSQLVSAEEVTHLTDQGMPADGTLDFRLSSIQNVGKIFADKFVSAAQVEAFLGNLVNTNPNIQNLDVDVRGELSTNSAGYVQSLEANGNDIRIYN